MADIVISPARNLTGAVRPPGDKSISHRCALLGGIAAGISHFENYSSGADCQSSLACMRALGVTVERPSDANGPVIVHGAGLHGLRAPAGVLDAGNSGSTLRLLGGLLAAQPFASAIGGDASLTRRPMRRIIEPLARMGARITAASGDRPPLQFSPAAGPLQAIEYALPVASAQVKSALLFAGLYAQGVTRITEPVPTRDHSELLLRAMGAPLDGLRLRGPVEKLQPLEKFRIPGDPSSAAFFLCAAAALPEADLLVSDVSLNPTRSALLDVLARLGARVHVTSLEEQAGELVGSLHLAPGRGRLSGATVAGAEAAALIDEIPILAVLATQTQGGIVFQDVGELRVKESDRIAAIAANLRAMGATCEDSATGLRVPGLQQLHGAAIASHGDHRIAMAFAIAALFAAGDTRIHDADCASISYPEFYATLARLTER